MLIPTHKLKAALLCAAKNDVRFYLNGVRVEYNGDSELLLIATDGMLLFAGQLTVESDAPAFALTIPNDAVKLALSQKADLDLLQHGDASWRLGAMSFVPLDGMFPDWRRVVPTAHTPQPDAQYKWDNLDTARKALALWHARKDVTPTIVRQGPNNGPGVATAIDDTALVVIMPLRAKHVAEQMVRPAPFI